MGEKKGYLKQKNLSLLPKRTNNQFQHTVIDPNKHST